MALPYSKEKASNQTRTTELAELRELIDELPSELKPRFEDAYHRAAARLERRRRVLSFIQESLSQLRLDTKYLVFDLEATRQERDEYRRQLEEIR